MALNGKEKNTMTSQTGPKKKEKGLYFSAFNDILVLLFRLGPPSSFALVPGNDVASAGRCLPRRLATWASPQSSLTP